MKTLINIFNIFILSVSYCFAVETLIFDASITPGVNYSLKWTNSISPLITVMPLGTNRSVSLTNGPWGVLTFWVVAVSPIESIESDPSNLLVATNRPAAPLQLRIQSVTNVYIIDGTINNGLTWQQLALVTNKPAVMASQLNQMFRAKRIQYPPLP